jgi:hypothetical protein
MNPLAFAALLLLQRADEALRQQQLSLQPDPYLFALLQRQKRRLCARLQRSPENHGLVGD